MRISDERLAEIERRGEGANAMRGSCDCDYSCECHDDAKLLVADLRDERALADKLAEALRASWDMSMAVRTSNLSDEVRAALAAYDAERGKR